MSAVVHTLRERAALYFGPGNVKDATGVPLGRYRFAWVTPASLWIYDEEHGRTSIVAPLTETMRHNLLDALEGRR